MIGRPLPASGVNAHVKNRRLEDADKALERAVREEAMWAKDIANLAVDHGLLPSPKLAREYVEARDRRDAAWAALDAERNRIPEQAGPRSGS